MPHLKIDPEHVSKSENKNIHIHDFQIWCENRVFLGFQAGWSGNKDTYLPLKALISDFSQSTAYGWLT